MATDLYTNLSQHATPTDREHLVPKWYVDAAVDRKVKTAVRVVSVSDLGCTYDSTARTLTQNAPAALDIDGVNDLAAGDRLLVAGQTDATQNGIYEVTTVGTVTTPAVLTRADDFDDSAEIPLNVLIPVSEGDQNKDTIWQLINDNPVRLDTDSLVFVKFDTGSGGAASFTTVISGDGTAKSWDVNHGLGTQKVVVSVYDAVSKELCGFGVKLVTDNQVKLLADAAPDPGESFIVVVVGG